MVSTPGLTIICMARWGRGGPVACWCLCRSGHYKQGEWPDLTWTIAFSLLILIAGTWNEKEEDVEVKSQSRSLQLLAQFSPLVIPAVVFPLVLSIAREQFYWSVALVLISFA